ncbi:hypothetical protein HYR69_09965, partial [Candidatus Sumerlaeota bacterium]|nr:hypothetical protein [Candidatus Sumerlaeota bacterium]
GSLLGSARLWIGEQDQFLHRVELSPPSHADGPKPAFPMAMPKTTTTYYDVTFDPPLTPADFGYAAPDGAEFHDMTAGE